jgi:hypothetical protein
MALIRETVAIPVARGVNVNTPARLVDAMDLLEATNVRFPAGVGARKRRGHSGQRVRGAKSLPVGWTTPTFAAPARVETYYTGDRSIPSGWLFGFGNKELVTVNTAVAFQTSDHPDGIALGMASRDNEQLVWDGHRLLSRTDLDVVGGRFTELNAVMPALRGTPIAKDARAQTQPDCADNGIIRVAAWINGGTAYYSVVDSQLGTTIVAPTALSTASVVYVRCVPVGTWVHVLAASSTALQLEMHSVHQDTPASVVWRSLGDCNGKFDVWKQSETAFATARATDTTIQVRIHDSAGGITSNWAASIGSPPLITSVALCQDPQNGNVALVWRTSTQVLARVFTSAGATLGSTLTLASVSTAARPVAVAPRYLRTSGDEAVFNAYWDDSAGDNYIGLNRFTASAADLYTATRWHHLLGSQGFRVGERTYIWAGRRSDYQSTWVLFDEELLPVGKANYITANTPQLADYPTLASVNWYGAAPAKDRCVYHCALSYRVRVAVEPTTVGINAPAVYAEPSIHFIQLDFLPRLRFAQAGRCTYFAGAQLWAYDGKELVENGFHYGPEGVTAVGADGGSLTALGTYIYRVDLCYRNAQNEEIRSASFYTASITLTGAQQSVTLTIPTALTRRSDAYFLIFRNENAGTVWNLVNSRDPSSSLFLRNNQSVPTVGYTDSTVADAALLSREPHPNQSFQHLDPFAAPAAEVIAAGRNRLWLAGGEIPAGQVYPSRLFQPGEVPAFHGDLAIQVDRSVEEITAIGFVGEYTIFFRRNHAYIEDSPGPDNEQEGDWSDQPRLAQPALGAVGPEGLALIDQGLVFQSPAGIRLVTPGGGVLPIGQPLDSVGKTADITAAVVVSKDQEVRFYSWSGDTLVYNYQYNTWSRWTVAAAGAVRTADGLAALATPQGWFLEEAEDTWTDNGLVYKMRVRFAWLRAGGLLDFQQVRRIGACGEGTSHSIRVEVFYNEREFPEEIFEWSFPDSTNNSDTFGSTNFGDGNLGDNSALEGINFADSTWPWRRRLFRRKCSVISIAIDDNYTNGEGFTLTALALELAKKPGLDRIPWRSGTYTNTGGSGSSETGN